MVEIWVSILGLESQQIEKERESEKVWCGGQLESTFGEGGQKRGGVKVQSDEIELRGFNYERMTRDKENDERLREMRLNWTVEISTNPTILKTN